MEDRRHLGRCQGHLAGVSRRACSFGPAAQGAGNTKLTRPRQCIDHIAYGSAEQRSQSRQREGDDLREWAQAPQALLGLRWRGRAAASTSLQSPMHLERGSEAPRAATRTGNAPDLPSASLWPLAVDWQSETRWTMAEEVKGSKRGRESPVPPGWGSWPGRCHGAGCWADAPPC